MKPRSVLYIIALLLIAILALVNWTALTSTVELSLLVAKVRAPLGAIILLIGVAIVAIDLIVQALSRRGWTRERRALVKEIESLRKRAENQEQSQASELRAVIEREFAVIGGQLDQLMSSHTALRAQLTSQRP